MEQSSSCNFDVGHYGELSFDFVLNLDQWDRRNRLKIFLRKFNF